MLAQDILLISVGQAAGGLVAAAKKAAGGKPIRERVDELEAQLGQTQWLAG